LDNALLRHARPPPTAQKLSTVRVQYALLALTVPNVILVIKFVTLKFAKWVNFVALTMIAQILENIVHQVFVLNKLALLAPQIAREQVFVRINYVQLATSQIINAKLSIHAKLIKRVGLMSAL
jgi:hypothetical protein